MKHETTYNFDKETGITTCIITDGNDVFYGIAKCAPEDRDMMNENTGCIIAENRASVKMLQYQRNILKYKYDAIHQYIYTINQSKKYNSNDYYVRQAFRQMRMYKEDIATIDEYIDKLKTSLRQFINDKDNFYKKIRANREKDNSK